MMEPLNIVMLVNVAPRKLGSLERWILAMGRESRQRRHRLHLLTHEPVHTAFSEGLEALGIEWTGLTALRDKPVKTVRFLRRFDAIHLNLYGPRAVPCLLAYCAWPVPVVFVDRFSDPADDSGRRRSLPRRILDRVTVQRIARYVGVSSYVVARAKARFGPGSTSYETILNGIDEEVFEHPPASTRSEARLRLLTAANLIPDKGIHHALDAVASLVDRGIPVHLRVAGDGPERPRLEAQAAQLAIEPNVEFLGLRDDVPALMRQSDIFLHPAVWNEAFGFTVAEAMAAGCAVVASRVGAIPELITGGETGILVEPGSGEAIAEAVARLSDDPARHRALAEAARTYALNNLGVTRSASSHLDTIETVARSG